MNSSGSYLLANHRALDRGGSILSADNLKFQGFKILVVDDEKPNVELMDVILSFYGAEVIATTSAIEALRLFPEMQPDLVISDIAMPEMSGLELIQNLRNLPLDQGSQVPALALTAFGDPQTRQKALAVGFQHFLVKPVDLPELVEVCSDLIKASAKGGKGQSKGWLNLSKLIKMS